MRSPSRHSCQDGGRSDKQGEAARHLILRAMHQTMQNPRGDISPGQLHIGGLVLAGTRDGEDQGDGVELHGLLHQVVVVVGLPAHGGGDLRVELLDGGGVVVGGLESLEDGDARGEHPDLHDEGPAIEGDDGGEEAGGLDG